MREPPNNALAYRLHVSPSTTLNRVRALRESGIL
ncbi:winged helix-turn-helix transcriptional regulator [Streptomyces sp. NBC_00080]